MAKTPDRSKMDVLSDFMNELGSFLKRLYVIYHGDRYLRDNLLKAVDLPSNQKMLRNRVPRTSEQAFNRISNGFYNKKRTEGSSIALWADTIKVGEN